MHLLRSVCVGMARVATRETAGSCCYNNCYTFIMSFCELVKGGEDRVWRSSCAALDSQVIVTAVDTAIVIAVIVLCHPTVAAIEYSFCSVR